MVITDILMPIMSGIDLIKQVKVINPDAQILVESAFSDIDLVREAMRMGAYDYILKPFTIDDMMISINRLIERLKFIEEKKNYVAMLERKIKETTIQLQNGFLDTLSSFVYALEVRDSYVHSHSQNVSKYSTIIAKEMKLDPVTIDDINIAGILHDIGKIGIPDAISRSPPNWTTPNSTRSRNIR
jgi:response regulator RpfG family c-di-GMP phosphodiesterase